MKVVLNPNRTTVKKIQCMVKCATDGILFCMNKKECSLDVNITITIIYDKQKRNDKRKM